MDHTLRDVLASDDKTDAVVRYLCTHLESEKGYVNAVHNRDRGPEVPADLQPFSPADFTAHFLSYIRDSAGFVFDAQQLAWDREQQTLEHKCIAAVTSTVRPSAENERGQSKQQKGPLKKITDGTASEHATSATTEPGALGSDSFPALGSSSRRGKVSPAAIEVLSGVVHTALVLICLFPKESELFEH